jgi:protein-disulfide isomerase
MWRCLYASVLILLLLASDGYPKGEVKNQEEIKISFKAVDMFLSRNGRYAYVLAQDGHLHIFKSGWVEVASINLGKGVLGIRQADRDDEIFVIDKDGRLKMMRLGFPKDIDTSNAPFKGNPKAKVEVVVFSDFECPYCASLSKVLDKVAERYNDKIKLIFKHCPLGYHKMALEAAQAAVAAGLQGKFWEFHDLLFENQKDLSSTKIQEIASALGLDMEKFKKDKGSPEVMSFISRDVNQAKALEVRGVPAVFINGEYLEDTKEESLIKEIEQRLEPPKSQ